MRFPPSGGLDEWIETRRLFSFIGMHRPGTHLSGHSHLRVVSLLNTCPRLETVAYAGAAADAR